MFMVQGGYLTELPMLIKLIEAIYNNIPRIKSKFVNQNTFWITILRDNNPLLLLQRMLDTLGKLFINDIRLVIVWSLTLTSG